MRIQCTLVHLVSWFLQTEKSQMKVWTRRDFPIATYEHVFLSELVHLVGVYYVGKYTNSNAIVPNPCPTTLITVQIRLEGSHEIVVFAESLRNKKKIQRYRVTEMKMHVLLCLTEGEDIGSLFGALIFFFKFSTTSIHNNSKIWYYERVIARCEVRNWVFHADSRLDWRERTSERVSWRWR